MKTAPANIALRSNTSTTNLAGTSPVVLVCEHASAFIPDEFGDLGLSEVARGGHIAWDLGAFEVARRLSELLDAALVSSTVSRLVYDCNRAPESASAIPETSETYSIPGNQGLSKEQRRQRVEVYYQPFERAVISALVAKSQQPVLVTIHSFAPVYFDQTRSVELGILHDSDTRLADAMLTRAVDHTRLKTLRNQPYGLADGVTHTLKLHGVANGYMNVMIEIRNDLIADLQQCQTMANTLHNLLVSALSDCRALPDGKRRQA